MSFKQVQVSILMMASSKGTVLCTLMTLIGTNQKKLHSS